MCAYRSRYIFAIIFAGATAAYFVTVDMSNEQNAENVMLVNEHFGTLWRCMISLFCAITGGNDWMMYAGPLRLFGQGELWFLMFVFYVLVCSVGVLNVVTGIHSIQGPGKNVFYFGVLFGLLVHVSRCFVCFSGFVFIVLGLMLLFYIIHAA